MAKKNFIQWLEEKVSELRNAGARNCVPVDNPKYFWGQFEHSAMAEYLPFWKKAITTMIHPLRSYDIEKGVKEEAQALHDIVIEICDIYSQRTSLLKKQKRAVDSLRQQAEYAFSVYDFCSSVAEEESEKKQVEKRREEGKKGEGILKKDEDEKKTEEIEKKPEEEEKSERTAKKSEEEERSEGTAKESEEEERSERTAKKAGKYKTLEDATNSLSKQVLASEQLYFKLEKEAGAIITAGKKKIIGSMHLLPKIELLNEFAVQYATNDTRGYLIERVAPLLLIYEAMICGAISQREKPTLTPNKLPFTSNYERLLSIASARPLCLMELDRKQGRHDYTSRGIIHYFEERCRVELCK